MTVPQCVVQVAAARAEAAWLERAPAARISAEAREADEVERAGHTRLPGEAACWRWRAGLGMEDPGWLDDPGWLAKPYLLEATGDQIGAARWWRDRGCPYEAALALVSSTDPELLRKALDTFGRLGTRPAAAVVAARLRALGERGVPRGPRAGTAANPAGLTRREGEVLALLADELSNPEIAASLVLSVRTVDHHVGTIFRKLGVHNRAQAREVAARIGLIRLLHRCSPPA